jgi:hypothetical protein
VDFHHEVEHAPNHCEDCIGKGGFSWLQDHLVWTLPRALSGMGFYSSSLVRTGRVSDYLSPLKAGAPIKPWDNTFPHNASPFFLMCH